MTQSFEVVRGGPAPVFASNAAAIYNNITRQGGPIAEGAVQVTLGDTGLYRTDAYWSGPVGENAYLAAGGFYRRHDGYRPNGFTNDEGGQFRVNYRKEFEKGEVRLHAKLLDDTNVFYLPIPVADPRDPSVSLDPHLDFFEGTLNTPALQNAVMLYPDEAGQSVAERRDLSDGRRTRYINLGADLTREFGDGWTLSSKARFTDGKVDFDALYSTSNPADADTFAAGQLAAAQAAFAGTTRLGYAIAGTNGATVYNPDADSGLVIQGQYRAIQSDFKSVMADTRVSKTVGFFGAHDLTVGLNVANWQTDFQWRSQDYLFELKTNPRTLDLVAYNDANQVTGYVTDRGVLRYGTVAIAGSSDMSSWALYAADNWQITSKLSIEAGLRHESFSGDGFGRGTQVVNLGNAATLADNSVRGFTSQTIPRSFAEEVTGWTFGANYDWSQQIGFYGRASKSFRTGGEGNLIFGNPAVTTEAEQFELGAKLDTEQLSVFLTAFYTRFEPFNASFDEFDADTGTFVRRNLVGVAESPGVEVDLAWTPLAFFNLDASVTYNDATIGEFGTAASVDGNQPIRQPNLYGNIRPSILFTVAGFEADAYLRYNFVGTRYVDLNNQTELPAYETLAAGLTMEQGPWSVQLVGENLTEEEGLTEGNPRSDQLSGQGSATAIYGRPLFGRNFRLVTTYRW
jgi:outer membrane receptor protein involved in Fe transport